MHLEVRHLRLVTAVARTRNLTRAAEELHLTQSALSHQLREIESRLGAALFLRTGKHMSLTTAGEQVLRIAEPILGSLNQVEKEIASRFGRGPEGVLRLTTECYTCYHWLPEVLAEFREQYPGVELRVLPDTTRRALRALLAGEADVAIVSQPKPNARLRFVHLFDDELVAVVHPKHPLAERPFARPQDFAGEPLVVYTMPGDQSTLLHDMLRPAGVMPGPITRVQLTEAIVELVKAGFGMTTLARWAVAPHVAAGTLAAVPLGREGCVRRWYAATRVHDDVLAYVTTFVAELARSSFGAWKSTAPQEQSSASARRRTGAQGNDTRTPRDSGVHMKAIHRHE